MILLGLVGRAKIAQVDEAEIKTHEIFYNCLTFACKHVDLFFFYLINFTTIYNFQLKLINTAYGLHVQVHRTCI